MSKGGKPRSIQTEVIKLPLVQVVSLSLSPAEREALISVTRGIFQRIHTCAYKHIQTHANAYAQRHTREKPNASGTQQKHQYQLMCANTLELIR